MDFCENRSARGLEGLLRMGEAGFKFCICLRILPMDFFAILCIIKTACK